MFGVLVLKAAMETAGLRVEKISQRGEEDGAHPLAGGRGPLAQMGVTNQYKRTVHPGI